MSRFWRWVFAVIGIELGHWSTTKWEEHHKEAAAKSEEKPESNPVAGAPLIFMKEYGTKPPNIGWVNFSCDTIAPYKKDYFLIVAERVTNRMVDLQNDTDIEKSQPFSILPGGDLEIEMQIPVRFIKKSFEINDKKLSIDFAVLMVPNGADVSKITTVAKVHDVGGLQLAANGVNGAAIERLLKPKNQSH